MDLNTGHICVSQGRKGNEGAVLDGPGAVYPCTHSVGAGLREDL